jgi:hypothetical protein
VSRAKLKHLLIDVHFFNLPKIRALGKRFDSAGKLSLVEAYCQMSCATNGVISLDAMTCIVEDNGIKAEKADEFLSYCLENNLIIKELDGYSNTRVIKDQESYGNKLEKDRKRKDSNGKKAESERVPLDSDIDFDFDNEDLRSNKKETVKTELLTLADGFNTPEIRKWVAAWREKLKSQGRPLSQMGLDALCRRYIGQPKQFLDALVYSCGLTKALNLIDPPSKDPPKTIIMKAGDDKLRIGKPLNQ